MRFAREIGDEGRFTDGGTVSESGLPAELFEHPKRDRTRAFLSQLSHRSGEAATRGVLRAALMDLDAFLRQHGIVAVRHAHPPVMTVEESERVDEEGGRHRHGVTLTGRAGVPGAGSLKPLAPPPPTLATVAGDSCRTNLSTHQPPPRGVAGGVD